MPRFVVLRHEFPPGHPRGTHWDLMLETADNLRTWALAAEPDSATSIEAQVLPAHRRAYLDYEGPVSGDRGRVSRWDAGQFQMEIDTAARLSIALQGARLQGRATLARDANQRWTFSFSSASEATRGAPSG